MFDAWLNSYAWTLRQTIRFKGTTMVVSALLLAGTVYLFRIVPNGFIPSVDTGQLNGQIEAIQGIGFDAMVAPSEGGDGHPAQKDPNVAAFTSNVGGQGGGRLNVDLKPRDQRTKTADEIIEELRPKLARIPGVRVVLSNPPAIRIGGMQSRAQYQFSLQDPDTEELYRVAPGFEAALRNVPGLLDVTSDLQIRNPELAVDLDREQIAALGLTVDQVRVGAVVRLQLAAGLADLRAERRVPGDHAGGAGVPAGSRRAVDALRAGAGGKLVPLSAVVTTRQSVGPQSINHIGQLPSVTSRSTCAGRRARRRVGARPAAGARDAARHGVRQLPGHRAGVPGFAARPRLVLALAIFVIYVVLGILYESFIHPLTILSGLPSAGFGALLTLLIFKQDLNIYAFVGIIMLVGLVKKNGIMMIDFAIEARRERAHQRRRRDLRSLSGPLPSDHDDDDGGA